METVSTYKFVNKSVFSQAKVILIQLLDYTSSPPPSAWAEQDNNLHLCYENVTNRPFLIFFLQMD